ncbi:DNA ligase D [Halalkalibacillus sediminis]|uniref:DNA ligase (ATP) n=1 Tax=Halalkalibacillus sediminis TaxID=2018042 RepID=A0A2I0QVP5_9BACI|nr:DNA ligase D [Halalkalibacillus sediminis]PKR78384.1 DNA ligase D [Halalkalibacillus sediminis]
MLKPMLPTLYEEAPRGKEWSYEIKYDGFRCGLEWDNQKITLWSRNGKDLTKKFQEVIEWCERSKDHFQEHLPIYLDGELAVQNTSVQSNFEKIQQRGRMKRAETIKLQSQSRPATFFAFDILLLNGKSIRSLTLQQRREKLENLIPIENNENNRIKVVQSTSNLDGLWDEVFLHRGEGIIAKKINSKYEAGKRSHEWRKIKNYKTVQGTITQWNPENDYFSISVTEQNQWINIGKVKNGFSTENKQTLSTFFHKNGEKLPDSSFQVPPSICADIHCLNAKDGELREPNFGQFRFDLVADSCTYENVLQGLAQFSEEIDLSNLEKQFFKYQSKLDFLIYIRLIAPYLLPHLKDRLLTVIRYPDGVENDHFYQKHVPSHAPTFIKGVGKEEEKHLVCQDLKSLIWIANQAAIEYHVPFQKYMHDSPSEMVFDLDPPSINQFPLAVEAAQLIKKMCEHQNYPTFVKTSGRKGLQIHIPLMDPMSYEQTREFMKAVSSVLVENYPESFTVERLKKHRGNRLYIDYVQHAKGKTIIAPYSPRATREGTVATPLFWNEVEEGLDPTQFTIKNIMKRIEEKGCPWGERYFLTKTM